MQVQVNGENRTIKEQQTISGLLGDLQLEAKMVVVERNKEIVPREQFDATALADGDTLEILHFVGGG